MKKTTILFALLAFSISVLRGQHTEKNNRTATQPFVLGAIAQIQSLELAEKRTVNIYLPEGYNADSATTYPVIYLLDGSADEDFIHIAGLVQFCNFPWIHILPKSIVVGIANVDRKRDYTFPTSIEKDKKDFPTTGGSAKFIAFVENELQPYIATHYKTNTSKTIIGQSLGGLLATEILFKKPGLFNSYIIISPSLWWDAESLLSWDAAILRPDFKQPINLFVGVGKEGKIMERDAKALAKKLKKTGNPQLKIHFEYFGKEDHGSILHLAVYNAFKKLNK